MKTGEKNTIYLPSSTKFYKLPLSKKIKILKEFTHLDKKDLLLIKKYQNLPDFIDFENNIGPFKIATNFLVNNKDYFVPMETEEPSVVAAASRGAKLVKAGGGFQGKYLGNEILGQVQLIGIKNFQKAKEKILKAKEKILKIANETDKFLFKLSAGAKDVKVKKVGNFLVVYLSVNPKDALGANIVNKMVEKIAPFISKITNAKLGARIVSNFTKKRIVKVEAKVPFKKLIFKNFSGEKVAENILEIQRLAELDLYRAVTHNKGIMNGIDAVCLATGNDFRAVESAIHSFASQSGKYKPISDWEIEGGFLKGKIEIPMPLAIVGGATVTQKAKLALKILRVKTAQELGIVSASVGLANNLSALFALATEGIEKGHLKIHRQFVKKIKK